MVIISNLKHNAFQQVDIAKPADLFKQVGNRVPDGSKYSGDEFLDPSLSKIQAAAEVSREVSEQPLAPEE